MPAPATVSPLPGQGDGPAPGDDKVGAEGAARGLIERQLGLLGRLAEAGLNIALAVERQVMAAEQASPEAGSPEAGLPEAGSPETIQRVQGLVLAYGRAARAVRLTVALQSRLVKDLQEIDATAARQRSGEAANAARELRQREAARKAARKERVERIVERMIRAEARDEAEVDRLADEAYERLEHDDIYGDLSTKPVSEIIARVCKDLGLAPDWSRWAQEAWAQEEMASGAPGSPLTTLRWLEPSPEPASPEPAGPGRGAADPFPPELRAASP